MGLYQLIYRHLIKDKDIFNTAWKTLCMIIVFMN